jgi:hypothetical protein
MDARIQKNKNKYKKKLYLTNQFLVAATQTLIVVLLARS